MKEVIILLYYRNDEQFFIYHLCIHDISKCIYNRKVTFLSVKLYREVTRNNKTRPYYSIYILKKSINFKLNISAQSPERKEQNMGKKGVISEHEQKSKQLTLYDNLTHAYLL